MGVERFARKSFGFVLALLCALGIYFQASGTMELVASSAFAAAPAPAVAKGRRPRHKLPTAKVSTTTNGDEILKRNAFDSVTGPLDKVTFDLPVLAEEPPPPEEVPDPLHVPECDDVSVNIVTES